MPDILNIAHRGASGHAPENTIPAFRLAIKQKADMIELDAHQTKDGCIIVHHDEHLKTGLLTKKNIKDMTLKEIKRVNRDIPALKQVLKLVKGKIRLNIEIKQGAKYYPAIEKNVYNLLKEERLLSNSIISSFDRDCLKNLRKISDDILIGFLCNKKDWEMALKEAMNLKAYSFHISYKFLSKEMINKTHKCRLKLFVYAINDVDKMKKAIELDVDGIFTDFPDRLRGILSHK